METEKILFKFVEACEELDIKYVLMCGTAWALYRDGEPFPNDDVDVAILCSIEEMKKLYKLLEEKGFSKGTTNANPGMELNTHFNGYGGWVDIYFQILKRMEPFVKSFDKVKFKGREFNLPHPIEEYLVMEYGEEWKTSKDKRSRPIHGLGNPDVVKEFDLNHYFNIQVDKEKKRMEFKDIK